VFVGADVHPLRGVILYLLDALPQVLALPLAAHSSVESFNASVLLRLAWFFRGISLK
jgi:hypothetical protein